MCLTYLRAGEFLQRWGPKFELCTFHQLILFNNAVLAIRTMDPEPVQDPIEATQEPAPEPMSMERSLSSESGSNSSLSTVYFAKKSGSAASSRSGSAASTSRSPPDQEVAARLLSWPSPSFAQGQGVDAEDDQPSSKTLARSLDKQKNESIVATKADSTDACEHQQQETKVIQELQKSSDVIVKEFRHTESIMIKEAEQAADSCCRPCLGCCRSVGTWGFCGDIAAVLCCPFTVISLLSCICFKCPKMFATKTKVKVKSVKARGKGEEHHTDREESEFEESAATTAKEAKHKEGHSEGHHEEKAEAIATTTSGKGPESRSGRRDSPIGSHRDHFFPSPEVEDDRPGGLKSGGR